MDKWYIMSIFAYPVSDSQVSILNFIGINGQFALDALRILSFLGLFLAFFLWYRLLKSRLKYNEAIVSVLVILISPLIFVLGLVYPLVCLKILIFTIGITLVLKNRLFLWPFIIVLILFNRQILNNKASIFYKLDFKDAQTEVTQRISSEDSLNNSIYIPLWIRRASYNKFFVSYKHILAEFLPYFDFESVFFQEINPFGQKSIVIFYWPEIYLFILGIHFLFLQKNNDLIRMLLVVLLVSWIDFVFSEGPIFLRLVLVIFPLSIIIGLGFVNLWFVSRKSNLLVKMSWYIVFLLLVIGFLNSIYDLNVRKDYWLDNRPLAFEFWFKNIRMMDINKYNKVQISSLVGDSKKYCYFYLKNICDSDKFVFKSFDLTTEKMPNSVYAGFAGEFVGSDFKNDINNNWNQTSLINIISYKTLKDTIANKFGNDIGVGIVN